MKKIYILLLLGLLTYSATLGQSEPTLDETLSWIKSKIEAYPLCEQICYTANVQYDLSKKELSVTYVSNLRNKVTYIIPLADINTGAFSYTRDFLFGVKTNNQSITWNEVDSYGNLETKKVSEIYLVFNGAQFRANDLESRLSKALKTAARLSGASEVKEVF